MTPTLEGGRAGRFPGGFDGATVRAALAQDKAGALYKPHLEIRRMAP